MTTTPSLALTAEEELLRDTVRSFAAERAPAAELRRLRDSGDPMGFSTPLWEEMAALGWAGLPFPAAVGGSEAGCFAAGVVMEQLGRTLAATPLLSTVLAGTCLAGAESPLAEKALAEAVEGRSVVALAFDEGAGCDPLVPATVSDRSGGSEPAVSRDAPATVPGTEGRGDGRFRLAGRKVLVIDGGAADYLVVPARCRSGVGLFLLHSGAEGLRRTTTRLVDSRRYATVDLDGVEVGPEALLVPPERGTAPLTEALDRGTAVLTAEMVGIMEAALEMTVAHLKDRRQFGVPIGSFQTLQHRAARMYVAVEAARSVVLDALRGIDAGASDASLRVSTAKVTANEALRLVTSEAVQMHGGMGITDEADIGLYLKRARVAELTLGDTAFHRRRFAALSGF